MSREQIRSLKRTLHASMQSGAGENALALGRDAALVLLERSISFGHARLAVVRLSAAVRAGSCLQQRHWSYCEEAAARSGDPALQALYAACARHAER